MNRIRLSATEPLWTLLLLLALAGGWQSASAEMVAPPQKYVIRATEVLVNELRDNGDAIRENPSLAYELADREVIPMIDFPLIAKRVLGKHWRRATQEQRERFTREFRNLIINLYVKAMVTYSKEIVYASDTFRYLPSRWLPGKTDAMVRMELKLSAGAPVEVGYRMRWKEGAWKVYDVNVMGLSLLGTYRRNFSSEIKRYGLDGVVERMVARNGNYMKVPEMNAAVSH